MLLPFEALEFVVQDVNEALKNARYELAYNEHEMHLEAIHECRKLLSLLESNAKEDGYEVTEDLASALENISQFIDSPLYVARVEDEDGSFYADYRNLVKMLPQYEALNTKNS